MNIWREHVRLIISHRRQHRHRCCWLLLRTGPYLPIQCREQARHHESLFAACWCPDQWWLADCLSSIAAPGINEADISFHWAHIEARDVEHRLPTVRCAQVSAALRRFLCFATRPGCTIAFHQFLVSKQDINSSREVRNIAGQPQW